jgi:hypothetical protein
MFEWDIEASGAGLGPLEDGEGHRPRARRIRTGAGEKTHQAGQGKDPGGAQRRAFQPCSSGVR